MIAGITRGSRAAEDGLVTGDIIYEVGDQRIEDLKTMQDVLAGSKSPVKAKIFREQKILTLTLHFR